MTVNVGGKEISRGAAAVAEDKKLSDVYAVTYDQVKEAYPDITWGGRS